MITGMRSDRHGMPGNGVPFLDDNIGLEPRYLQADSLFTLVAVQAPELITAEVDWSTPDSTVSLAEGIAADDLLADQVIFAVNGGAALFALLQPAAPTAPEALRRLREIALRPGAPG